MPPKQSKAEVAKKQKVVEDKTFGLKNKNKSKNVQKYVQSLQQNVIPKPDPSKLAAKKKKEEEKAREKELNDLFKIAVVQPKVPVGVDPKSILCEFFKAGQCAKGFKCKFSHDLNVQRKGEKIDIFSDKRDEETMEDWDLEMLEKVVASKGKEYNQNKPTDIVCKHFLDAVEKKQYGWFWVCPNGNKECHYRHALPPGYILKSQMKALLEEEANKLAIEDEIEDQRSKVKTTTPMTTDLFMQWKKKKVDEKEAGLAAQRAERAKNDRMSGRELFLSDASVFVDDAEAYEKYNREEEPDNTADKAQENSSSGGPSTSTNVAAAASEDGNSEINVDDDDDDDDDLDMDELNELEASLAKTSIQIKEPVN
ncbi:putative transcription factor C3H family [Helianthus annuus]|uniref:Putative zinc finger, CCCH-type, ZC3H15/TMA46 family n=1 Tax=Helianthus annuus TaxID=4232 RepID=A0A251T224_HELAN|nr:zinc finger CCCH domain-containing protein 11 [Helianthus annuus]KAF5777945.1 putative transcription factor C3H family [Helianthus annuus]KAJ0505298.1 putative transcription factor C3H family [Helianthus annuus]KAJ0674975.1 putative transcription factor C3H family [Helianthus annuus]KAJ0862716.1 putative transcription factor C3H family [Helianthus annuus]KAJ0866521.1 putative transcription factor C3H family [Helianthus annuus]